MARQAGNLVAATRGGLLQNEAAPLSHKLCGFFRYFPSVVALYPIQWEI